LAKDERVAREYLYWHHLDNRALREGDWKVVAAAVPGGYGPWELYDLRTDRSEMHDLAARYPERVQKLAARWQECETAFRREADLAESSRSAADELLDRAD
jgi:arylsulfatase